MKINKKIRVLPLLLALIFAALGITAFAADSGKVIDSDCFYIEFPPEYSTLVKNDDDTALIFSDNLDVIESITVKRADNTDRIAVSQLKEKDAANMFLDAAGYDTEDYKINRLKTKFEKINGFSALKLSGKVFTTLYDLPEDNYESDFSAYIFTTEQYCFSVIFEKQLESYKDIADFTDVENCINTVAINGIFFNGDEPTKEHTFSDKSFEDAIDESAAVSDEELDEITETVLSATFAIGSAIFIIPTATLIIISVVLIVKHIKRKKILERYEFHYGPISDFGGYNPGTVNYGYPQNGNAYYQPTDYRNANAPYTGETTGNGCDEPIRSAAYNSQPQQPQSRATSEQPQQPVQSQASDDIADAYCQPMQTDTPVSTENHTEESEN